MCRMGGPGVFRVLLMVPSYGNTIHFGVVFSCGNGKDREQHIGSGYTSSLFCVQYSYLSSPIIKLVKIDFLARWDGLRTCRADTLSGDTKRRVTKYWSFTCLYPSFLIHFSDMQRCCGYVLQWRRLLGPLFSKLFPDIPKGHPVNSSVYESGSQYAGTDNAPLLGLKAMEGLQELNPKKYPK